MRARVLAGVMLALPQAGLPASRLVLETGARVFTRRVRVWEEDAGGASLERSAGSWTHLDPETAAPPMVVALPALGTRRPGRWPWGRRAVSPRPGRRASRNGSGGCWRRPWSGCCSSSAGS